MDIAFHYFAVKAIACAAGYDENSAQRIASFSQFIDDFNWYFYRYCGNIPDYITTNSELDFVVNKTLGMVNPVTTGFSDTFDMATLIRSRSQKFTVSPFHFIPMNEDRIREKRLWAVPATLQDGSYIAGMLDELRREIVDNHNKHATGDDLMHMGMLFHTFADTYAHQLFSGYAEKRNAVILNRVMDSTTGTDVTEQYMEWIESFTKYIKKKFGIDLPGIGHMLIMHIPDLTHLYFEMQYTTESGEMMTYSRSNHIEFLRPAEEIYRFMRECLSVPENMSWDDLRQKLAEAFLYDAAKEINESEERAVQKLTVHWAKVFPHYRFAYNSKAIKSGFVLDTRSVLEIDEEMAAAIIQQKNNLDLEDISEEEKRQMKHSLDGINVDENGIFSVDDYSDDFYKFNLFADRLLIRLYGSHPRK